MTDIETGQAIEFLSQYIFILENLKMPNYERKSDVIKDVICKLERELEKNGKTNDVVS